MSLRRRFLGTAACSLFMATSAHAADPRPATPPAVRLGQDDGVVLDDIDVVARRLDLARSQIQPSLGATKYDFGRSALETIPQGDNAPLNQVLLRAPGVAQDSFGQFPSPRRPRQRAIQAGRRAAARGPVGVRPGSRVEVCALDVPDHGRAPGAVWLPAGGCDRHPGRRPGSPIPAAKSPYMAARAASSSRASPMAADRGRSTTSSPATICAPGSASRTRPTATMPSTIAATSSMVCCTCPGSSTRRPGSA